MIFIFWILYCHHVKLYGENYIIHYHNTSKNFGNIKRQRKKLRAVFFYQRRNFHSRGAPVIYILRSFTKDCLLLGV
jgi:hypothetical protein